MFEGSRLKEPGYCYLSKGAYGVVFVNRLTNRIRKVAYRKNGTDEAHCRAVFENEMKALEIAQSSPVLRPLVAIPANRIVIDQIVDSSGQDISDSFYTNMAFEAEFIAGQFYKIGSVNAFNRDEIIRQFKAAGIHHILDASVVLNDNAITKLIDFAVKEEELFW